LQPRQLPLLTLLLTILFQSVWSQTDDLAQEVYLSFRFKGDINEIIVAQMQYGEFYLPLIELFQLLGIEHYADPGALTVRGRYLQGGPRYTIDLSAHRITIGRESTLLPASHFIVKETDYYLVPSVFDDAFGLRFEVDLSRLVLDLKTVDEMPVVTRQRMRSRQVPRLEAKREPEVHPLRYDRNRRFLDGFMLDYSGFATVADDNLQTNLNLTLGGEVLYGDLYTGIRGIHDSDGSDILLSEVRWRYVRPMLPWFTTFTLGAVQTGGLLSQTFDGVMVSNEPIEPRISFDEYVIADFTEADSEVEIFQNNQLVAATRADESGYYRVVVPLNYGLSDLKIRIYGPSGRITELDRRLQIPFTFLRPGDIQVHMGFGRIDQPALGSSESPRYGIVSVNTGLRSWISNRVIIEYSDDAFRQRPFYYDQVNLRLFGPNLMTIDLAPQAFTRITSQTVFPNSANIFGSVTVFHDSSAMNPTGRHREANLNLYIPSTMKRLPVTNRFSVSYVDAKDVQSWRSAYFLSVQRRNFRLQTSFQDDQEWSSSYFQRSQSMRGGITIQMPRTPNIHRLIRGSYYRLETRINTSSGDLETIDFTFLRKLGRAGRFQSSVQYDISSTSMLVNLTYLHDFEPVRTSSSMRSARGRVSYTQTARGSVVLDRAYGEWLFDNRQQAGRSGVTVRMYVDENASGSYEPGEEIIPGNAVRLERASSRVVDRDGRIRLSQLQPYRRYNFTVNEALIRNPALVPKYKEFSLITDPNRFKSLDIPLVTTGIIEGRVERNVDGELVPVGGLRIRVRSEDGNFEKTYRTFSDGTYYAMEIPPGDYTAEIDASQLAFLQVYSVPRQLEFRIEALPEGDFKEGLDFLLE